MWNRKVLKARGKRAFKANYWKCVLVALIVTLVAGGGGGSSGFSTTRSFNNSRDSINQYDDYDYYDDYDDYDEYDDDYDYEEDDYDLNADMPTIDDIDDYGTDSSGLFGGMGTALAGIIILIVLVVFVIIALLGIFLLNPLQVGCRKFFLNNSNGKEFADIGDVGFVFSTNYSNVVKTMFIKDLWILLWTLLLIVPGVIKSYEYRMVPYLLAENPDMDRKEALKASGDMMYGKKWNSFILDFSFFGWYLLSTCTLGILGIFYVNPYVNATDAELYKAVSGKRSGFADEADAAAEASENKANAVVPNTEIPVEPVPDGEDVIVTFNESDGETYLDDIYD